MSFRVAWLVALLTAGGPALVVSAALLAYRVARGEPTSTDGPAGALMSGVLYGTPATVISLAM